MKSYLLSLLFILTFGQLVAQNKGKISGHVIDAENKPLAKATISIINPKDSTVLSYSLTDEKGKFEFIKLPILSKLNLFITHINAETYLTEFEIDNNLIKDFGHIQLGGKSIEEVVITATPPIRMNNDTLEYNADYFKTRPNANVEELLKELPGLQVNMDGTIYYQGKEVSQVKVNGKDFFTSDLRIATRNLDASLVKTIQVYRDRGESKKLLRTKKICPLRLT